MGFLGRALGIASVGLIAGVLAIGCGGSSSGGSTSTSSVSTSSGPLDKSEFVQQANAICANAESERDEVLRSAGGAEPTGGELAMDALPPVQKMTEELGELTPPAGDEKQVTRIVAAFEAGIEKIEANPGDLNADIAAFAEADRLAEAYGLTECTI
jgi:hypothetical protein